ncbi:MAG: nucleotide exchange factor GrpE [Hahellaceae bacterium]|nr:nucleotide exchange factor GrpE [Hahellaceae bacterium]
MANENAQGGECGAVGERGRGPACEEVANVREQLLRAHAEMQNVRRRAENDVDKARKFALERFCESYYRLSTVRKKLLMRCPVKRCLSQLPSLGRVGDDLFQWRSQSLAGKFDVEVVDPVGQPFKF